MRHAPLSEHLGRMLSRHAAVRGCALVDACSGLIWHREPNLAWDGLWEAAVDHWRLHRRLSGHFGALGDAGAIVTYHRGATMAMLPCLLEPEVILVCVAAPSAVDWKAWQDDAKVLGRCIQSAA